MPKAPKGGRSGPPIYRRRPFLMTMATFVLSSLTRQALAGAEEETGEVQPSAAKHGLLFVGSSSIRLWQVTTYFPSLPCTNVGVGGFHISDVNHALGRLVFPHEPKVIVFYAGDNDIAAGKTPGQVLTSYREFVHRVRGQLPDARIVFISIKPSVLRRALWGKMRQANRMIEQFCRSDERLAYADVATPMLDGVGSPRRDLFAPDGLHLNGEGYRLWTGVISPIVERAYNEP